MKKILTFTVMIMLSIGASAQEHAMSISGGYVFANVEEVETNANGWRINGLYEYLQEGGKIAHGVSFGYIHTTAEYSSTIGQTVHNSDYKFNTFPIYYAPKFMFGSETAKGFIKGAIGAQYSSMTRTSTLGDITVNDAGFYGGAGVGFMKTLGEKAFINIEYEWAYLSNDYYKDGFINSIMLGVGVKLK